MFPKRLIYPSKDSGKFRNNMYKAQLAHTSTFAEGND
jgi:hypothetical protein